jgi:hypothetical protein
MATKKSTTPALINDLALGELAPADFVLKQYKAVYYAIRELTGLSAKRKFEIANPDTKFDWAAFKAKYAESFGECDDRTYSLEQWLEYSHRKFGKSLEELIALNELSFKRREEWEARKEAEALYHQSPFNTPEVEPEYDYGEPADH